MPEERRTLSLKLFKIPSTWYNEKHFSFEFSINNVPLYHYLHPGAGHNYYSHHPLCLWFHRNHKRRQRRSSWSGGRSPGERWCVLVSKWRNLQGGESGQAAQMHWEVEWDVVRDLNAAKLVWVQERMGEKELGLVTAHIPFNEIICKGTQRNGCKLAFFPLKIRERE